MIHSRSVERIRIFSKNIYLIGDRFTQELLRRTLKFDNPDELMVDLVHK